MSNENGKTGLAPHLGNILALMARYKQDNPECIRAVSCLPSDKLQQLGEWTQNLD